VLELYDQVTAVILPTLGPERRATYSPFLPVSPKTGRVLQVPVLERDVKTGKIIFEDEDGTRTELPVTGGHCKLQWKADWAMRWYALGVDYEMSGKDLISSVELSSKICKVLGREPPATLNYELFLDENAERISKSKGNGISIEQWLRYASPESLSFYMYQKPKTAKRLYFDVIPKAVDEYAHFLDNYENETPEKQLDNPTFHIHGHNLPTDRFPVTFALLLNLVSASNAHDREVLWGFIRTYAPGTSPKTHPALDKLVDYALRYYEDFVKPTKRYRAPTDKERAAFEELAAKLDTMEGVHDGETIQNEVYEVGKKHKFEPLRDWFKALYEVLFGQEQGPRFGSFAALYGAKRTAQLIRDALSGSLLREPERSPS
jgi:lysyl-tRNA synthetase class 1